jgi:hypothetical protein
MIFYNFRHDRKAVKMSTMFMQMALEDKVGKGHRILRPLKRDPAIEVSAYRDNQFKVS